MHRNLILNIAKIINFIDMGEKTYKKRLREAMDMVMLRSVSKQMAVAACAKSASEAMQMMEYINNNL